MNRIIAAVAIVFVAVVAPIAPLGNWGSCPVRTRTGACLHVSTGGMTLASTWSSKTPHRGNWGS